VAAAYRGSRPVYGPDYIIPVPFDPRLISRVSRAVAEAAIKTGVARRAIKDLDQYSYQLSARLDPSAILLQTITSAVRAKPKRVVFAEGEDEAVIRAAYAFQNSGLGKPILVGRADVVRRGFKNIGLDDNALDIRVPLSAQEVTPYVERLYKRLQRRGVLYRDAVRMVTNDRNIYAAAMLAAGDADAMVTGVTRNYAAALTDVRTVIDASHGVRPIGLQVIFAKGRIVLVADTSITELPDSEQLADIAIRAAATAKKLGLTPRVAMLASSTFGFPRSERSERIIEAVHILDTRGVDFEYDGEFAPDVALDRAKLDLYPFTRLSDTANVLVMPAMHSAQISTKLLQQLGGVNVMGPLLVGLEKSVQIAPLGAKMSEIYNAAIVAAYDIND
jgi:malate dehydrogenase (oxaloacetate-decarboxylating)(NADP+)